MTDDPMLVEAAKAVARCLSPTDNPEQAGWGIWADVLRPFFPPRWKCAVEHCHGSDDFRCSHYYISRTTNNGRSLRAWRLK